MVEHLNTYSMDFFAVRTAFLDHFADKTKSYYQSIRRLYPTRTEYTVTDICGKSSRPHM